MRQTPGAELLLRIPDVVQAPELRSVVAEARAAGASAVTLEVDAAVLAQPGATGWLREAEADGVDVTVQDLGNAALAPALAACASAGLPGRVVARVAAAGLSHLSVDRLDAVAAAGGVKRLSVVLVPALAREDPAPLTEIARRLDSLAFSRHEVACSALWPACAVPEELPTLAPFPEDAQAAARRFTAACDGCALRAAGRCEGIPAALLALHEAAHGPFAGPRAFGLYPPPPRRVEASLEEVALRIGVRRVWRRELPRTEAAAAVATATARSFAAVVTASTLEPAKTFPGTTTAPGVWCT